jgi:hypothetical protein
MSRKTLLTSPNRKVRLVAVADRLRQLGNPTADALDRADPARPAAHDRHRLH